MQKLSFNFVFYLLFALVCGSCENSSNEIKQLHLTQPNIVLILADDLGYGDLSCYGSKRINTPNIDKMAGEGLKFTQFYAGSAVCTPTRVSILTGQYPLRFNVSAHFNDREMFLDNDVLTIPKVLKKEGYTSMHIGKWHLGGLNESHVLDRNNSMPGPLQHGFDHYLAMLEDPIYRGSAMREKRLYKDAGKNLVKDDVLLTPNNKHWTTIKFEEANKFIENSAKEKRPFFLNLWLDAPHAPYEYSEKGVMDQYNDRAKGQDLLYRGMVSHLDKGVGGVLAKLKELNIDKNTIVIFTSDNGPAYLGSPAHFKGRKTDFHEGGIRVPMIVWWPETITKGTVSNEIANTIDFLPTFLKLAQGTLDKNSPMDGLDITPILFEQKPLIDRKTMFWEIATKYKRSGNYVNVTDIRLKPTANQIARKGPWKLLAIEGVPQELYNMDEDPYERWNLLDTYPDISKQLSKELTQWLNAPRKEQPY
ncbi:MAG: sulfatase-like hydrolase/transferase [Polaribacter sp.]|nr:sulfatase-like hydrolase/transferase [Polaribacter sp.]